MTIRLRVTRDQVMMRRTEPQPMVTKSRIYHFMSLFLGNKMVARALRDAKRGREEKLKRVLYYLGVSDPFLRDDPHRDYDSFLAPPLVRDWEEQLEARIDIVLSGEPSWPDGDSRAAETKRKNLIHAFKQTGL